MCELTLAHTASAAGGQIPQQLLYPYAMPPGMQVRVCPGRVAFQCVSLLALERYLVLLSRLKTVRRMPFLMPLLVTQYPAYLYNPAMMQGMPMPLPAGESQSAEVRPTSAPCSHLH